MLRSIINSSICYQTILLKAGTNNPTSIPSTSVHPLPSTYIEVQEGVPKALPAQLHQGLLATTRMRDKKSGASKVAISQESVRVASS